MSILAIAESKNWGLILVSTKHGAFCVMSNIGHNSPVCYMKTSASEHTNRLK